jgi:hypothetical protein
MKPFHSRLSKVICLILGIVSLFSLATHASSPAPQKALKLPKLIDGDFTYTEYIKSDTAERFIEDEEKVKVELTLELLQQDPSGQMAFYRLDNASFSANGKATFVIKSPAIGCVETHIYERTGGGLMDFIASTPTERQITPTTLIWFIQDKRFSLTFVSPVEKGKEIHTSNDSCSKDKPAPITSPHGWTLPLEGAVDYNAQTKTYRFVLLDKYTVPCRDAADLRSNVYVLGELKGKAG